MALLRGRRQYYARWERKSYLFIIDEPVEFGLDIYPHPKTTIPPNAEFLTKRPLKVKLIAEL